MDRDAKWLAWFEQQFSNLAGSDRQIDIEEFKEALHVKEVSVRSQYYTVSSANKFIALYAVFLC